MAGGTGGHIFPGLAVASELMADGIEVRWLGTPHGLENKLVPAAGIELDRVSIKGLRGRGLSGWLLAPWRVLKAVAQAWQILRRQKPDCVLSMGGYAAGPGGLAARLLGIGLVIHEQNAIAGWTNRLLAPFARIRCSGFPNVFTNARVTGNPVRAEITELPTPVERFSDRTGPLRMLIIGGSQGALALNQTVPAALALIDAEQRPRVRHQAGRSLDMAREHYAEAGVVADVLEFIDDMPAAWAWADLAICRSGALTVAELAAAGVAAVLVPFPAAVDDHQTANARYLADADSAWRVSQSDFTPTALAEHLQKLDRTQLAERAQRARSLALPDAARLVAQACREVMP
ncbi:MAG: undecaprenyldiphospho-muramoylpentapeptide beta-N-acetylglucosaminyltransferase [Pseudomonadota bacterium]